MYRLIDGRVAPRSGLAVKNFIDTGAGVIDSDYRGQVKVLLFNHSDTDFEVKEGDRVAQLIIERVSGLLVLLFWGGYWVWDLLTVSIDLYTGGRSCRGTGRECERSWRVWEYRLS